MLFVVLTKLQKESIQSHCWRSALAILSVQRELIVAFEQLDIFVAF